MITSEDYAKSTGIKRILFKFEEKKKQMLDGGGGVPGTSGNVLNH